MEAHMAIHVLVSFLTYTYHRYILHFYKIANTFSDFKLLFQRKPHPCNMCEKTFQWKQNLRAHKKKMHNEGEAHECEKCHQRFGKRSNLLNKCSSEIMH